MFFALRPKLAKLSDINEELINTYLQVRSSPHGLISLVQSMPVTKEFYDSIRASEPDSAIARAARFLYLNRTAFSGMYRVNRAGRFNVPFGGGERTPSILWEANLLVQAAEVLRCARCRAEDFEDAMARAEPGDVVYCDPTYTVTHSNNGFLRYNERIFSWADQLRLAACARASAQRGIYVLISNATHPDVLRAYDPPAYVTLTRSSCLSPRVSFRGQVEEHVLIYPPSTKGLRGSAR